MRKGTCHVVCDPSKAHEQSLIRTGDMAKCSFLWFTLLCEGSSETVRMRKLT